MNPTLVINAVALTPDLIGPDTPRLAAFRDAGRLATVTPDLPAVTCTVQSSYLTGTPPNQHGIVGNGWYDRTDCEVKFWKQANPLVQREKIWDLARRIDPSFTVANCFWWFNMYSTADYAVTPRPQYPADGRKLPDIHSHPAGLRDTLQKKIGQFPLFKFWGPLASIESTNWIAASAIEIDKSHKPILTLVYLPHLDYPLQIHGPDRTKIASDLRALDAAIGKLLDHFSNHRVVILSEYGITPVNRPVHVNRALREAGLLAIRHETGREYLDAGASAAFAVADHQLAHVYTKTPAALASARAACEQLPGVSRALDRVAQRELDLDHDRAGDLVLLAEEGAWFTYYFWLDDAVAPDYARTVDIHRKPGYDPAELFLDPRLAAPKLRVARRLFARKLGFRNLLDVTPLDASLVRGSHGLLPPSPELGPLLMTNTPACLTASKLKAVNVHDVLLAHVTD